MFNKILIYEPNLFFDIAFIKAHLFFAGFHLFIVS